MKKILQISAVILFFGGILLLIKKTQTNCEYPVFDLTYKGQVVEACFQATSTISHEHKNSEMIEVVSPSAKVSNEILYFENNTEMALFACQIIFKSRNKQPVSYESIAASPVPQSRLIKAQNHLLIAADSSHNLIIDRLFCMANK